MAIHPNDLSRNPRHDDPIACHNLIRYPAFWCCIMLFLVIISGIGLLVFFISLDVKSPNLEIDSLTLSNFSLSSTLNQISADWNVQMSLKTVDSHGYFKVSDIKVSISYSNKIVWETDVMSFHVSPKNHSKHFGKEFLGWSDNVDDSAISDIRGRIDAGTVKFDVGFVAWVKPTYISGWGRISWFSRYLWIVNCENVEVFFGSSDVSKAQMLGASQACEYKEVYPDSD